MTTPIGKLSQALARKLGLLAAFAASSMLAVPPSAYADITVNVVDAAGNPVDGFRWLLEQDPTIQVDPTLPACQGPNHDPNCPTLAFEFHKSYAPVVDSGDQDTGPANVPTPGAGDYFVTVTPYGDYGLSGTRAKDGDTVTITVNPLPYPTAQISIFVYPDLVINGAPDLPEEADTGVWAQMGFDPTLFTVHLEDPAGRYGQNGGPIFEDAFGNPLGTVYARDAAGNPIPDGDGWQIQTMGTGTIHPGPDGVVRVKNLAPGKYGVTVNPPAGQGWIQTSTIEGTPVIDAWVAADEPPFFVEFGPPGHHVWVGYTRQMSPSGGSATITGQVRNIHMSRPPDYTFYTGNPFPACWVGLNVGAGAAVGAAIAALPCNGASEFSIPNVPDGDYTLVVWDDNLDVVIASTAVSVAGADVNLGDVPVFNWFARMEGTVFADDNENGFLDAGEAPLGADRSAVNLRWRDGTIYQSFPIDTEGKAPFDEVFPFFHWLVAEVDFANLKATGVTYYVDAGGPVDLTPGSQFEEKLGPYTCDPLLLDAAEGESCTADGTGITQTGPVLTLGFQGYLGQTSMLQFGKKIYGTTAEMLTDSTGTTAPTGNTVPENGGISGIVFYATTRAENDPRLAAAETWEPGIPRVQVNLYQSTGGGRRVDQDGKWADGTPIANLPLTYRTAVDNITEEVLDSTNTVIASSAVGAAASLEDLISEPVVVAGVVTDYGDALQVTWTDSWDDSQPTNCQGDNASNLVDPNKCFDGLRSFNQVRPGVFDGGYAFDSYQRRDPATGAIVGEVSPLPTDFYVVQAKTPAGYELLKEEDNNVAFGDSFIPGSQKLSAREDLAALKLTTRITADTRAPAACIGDKRVVPDYLSYLTHEADGTLLPGVDPADAAAPHAGESRPLCDRKLVILTPGKNAAADFFAFTRAPISANVVGGILNDLANEFDPNSPNFGEKYAPPYLPVVFYDWQGNEITRTHGDQYGKFNARLPSTVSANLPQPSGMSPNMLTSCMNDVHDPFHDSRYSQFCYQFQYMPGATTYLDTPVLAISAFAGKDNFPLDCQLPEAMPAIASVTGPDNKGPVLNYMDTRVGAHVLTITSAGMREVRNPDFDSRNPLSGPKFITRNNGFGTVPGTIQLTRETDGAVFTYPAGTWDNDTITLDLPEVIENVYQLDVITADGVKTRVGVTLHVRKSGGDAWVQNNVISVGPGGAAAGFNYGSIQEAIDAVPGSGNNRIVTVAPGEYNELVIMHKPVKLQGWGAYGTIINASKFPAIDLRAYRQKIGTLLATDQFDLLPGQGEAAVGGANNEPDIFAKEEGAGIMVLGDSNGTGSNSTWPNNNNSVHAIVDGFQIVGANTGGGVYINGYVRGLVVSNMFITGNEGTYGGGIRSGDPTLLDPATGRPTDSRNDNLILHHNQVAQNGSLNGAGGGIALYKGTDNYRVTNNWVCGNFSQGDGGGIGHLGLSDAGRIGGNNNYNLIADNLVSFNQSFNQGLNVDGGGIFVGGLAPTPGVAGAAGTVQEGAGRVRIEGNLILGNNAGAGDGAGIATRHVNGADVDSSVNNSSNWYDIRVYNNIVANNVAGFSGAGISLQDTLLAEVVHNTVVNNDNTSTVGAAFPYRNPATGQVDLNRSTAQAGAGLLAQGNSGELQAVLSRRSNAQPAIADFSNPVLQKNIFWRNRWYHWAIDSSGPADVFGLVPGTGEASDASCMDVGGVVQCYSDLAVRGSIGILNPVWGVLTDTTDYSATNSNVAPDFVAFIPNGDSGQGIQQIELTTTIAVQPALDEGGNFIDVRYGPLNLPASGDYHLTVGYDAAGTGLISLVDDIDGDPRDAAAPDRGADEYLASAAQALIAKRQASGSLPGLDSGGLTPIAAAPAASAAGNTAVPGSTTIPGIASTPGTTTTGTVPGTTTPSNSTPRGYVGGGMMAIGGAAMKNDGTTVIDENKEEQATAPTAVSVDLSGIGVGAGDAGTTSKQSQ